MAQVAAQSAAGPAGVREAAWAPDGRRIATSWFDAIWTMTPEGRDARRLIAKPGPWITERDPAYSPDGKTIVFAANTNGQFDLWTVPAGGGAASRITSLAGDERWPSYARDGRLVFSHRGPGGVWQLFVAPGDANATPTKLTPDAASEWQGRVSPDGKSIAFISDREPIEDDDTDVWVREWSTGGEATPRLTRLTEGGGVESHPAWAPDNVRVAYFATRPGLGSGVWVSAIPEPGDPTAAGRGRGAGRGGVPFGRGAGRGPNLAALVNSVLASRHGGVPAWSPDGEALVIATFPTSTAGYNGNPNRNDDDPPIAFGAADDYQFWKVEAPRAIDEGAASVGLPGAPDVRWTAAFDQVWQTLKSLYYGSGPSADVWDRLREKYRPEIARASSANAAEDVIDRMIAEQPLIKPAVSSTKAVVASGHPLASAAGAAVLERGGNVVDAGIAVSLALGVVEPEASSLGGDGQAILFLKGMSEPVVIEYKDMTPSHATPDNPKLFNPNGGRTAADGPTVANIPGVAAGLDLLYQKYSSKKVAWADLVAPAITLADEGFVLDEALPTSIAQGRASFSKYPEAAKIFLPNGRVPRPGDRFTNKDYAQTLRTIAKEGASSFYRGSIAQRIAADMAANGGVITAEDLAQYRAIERKPIVGRYRDHLVYSVPAPVSTGLQVVETLQILDNYPAKPGARYTSDADYLHYVIDAWRVRDGGARIADPERYPVDLGNHLDRAHALERFKLLNPAKAFAGQGGGRGGGPAAEPGPYQTEDETRRVQTGTTAFVVADAEGNMIAFTQTLSTWGGNYYVSKGLGFIYNDHFRGGGGRGGGFGSMLPLMRSSSTSVPTLVFAPQRADPGNYGIPGYAPRIAVGCAGNAWIPASVYNIILNVVDGGMSAQEAIEAPRLLIGGGAAGSRVQIEDRLPRTVLADLEKRGHAFDKVGRKGEVKYGYAAVAVVSAAKGTVEGGADPRRSHATAAPK
ncbi:MAG TPA: gamma-glutamyltransferase [Vicinamibacterales bacterium]|nr:gamma-glutamyltransferase [Vicinamibacterales bacterium]